MADVDNLSHNVDFCRHCWYCLSQVCFCPRDTTTNTSEGGSSYVRQFATASAISLSLFIMGSGIAWPSPVIYEMTRTGRPMNITDLDIALLGSLAYAGNVVSPIPSGMLSDQIGRKMTIQISCIAPLSSWLIVYFSTEPWMLHISRFIMGLFLGVVCSVIPIYIAEIAVPEIRGALSQFFNIMVNLGVMFIYAVGSKLDFYVQTYILGSLPIIVVVAVMFIPESPIWLTLRGKYERAIITMQWLLACPRPMAEKEIKKIDYAMKHISEPNLTRKKDYEMLFRMKHNRRALTMVLILAAAQRFSGVSALVVYSSTTLPDGVGVLTVNDCVTLMGTTLIVSAVPSMFLVDRVGKKTLLFCSSIGCALSMLGCTVWFFFDSETDVNVRDWTWIPFCCLLLFFVSFSMGLGPLPITIQGEMFEPAIKGVASGITTMTFALSSFIVTMVYVKLEKIIGVYANFLMYTLVNFLTAWYVCIFLIETRGRSLRQIQRIIRGGSINAGYSSSLIASIEQKP